MAGSQDRGGSASHPHARKWKGYERHVVPGWFEWSLREPVRYCYLLGVFTLAILVPLQMGDSFLPEDAPAVLPAAVVAFLAIAFVIGLLVLAAYGYRGLWGADGRVDRAVERHLSQRTLARSDDHSK